MVTIVLYQLVLCKVFWASFITDVAPGIELMIRDPDSIMRDIARSGADIVVGPKRGSPLHQDMLTYTVNVPRATCDEFFDEVRHVIRGRSQLARVKDQGLGGQSEIAFYWFSGHFYLSAWNFGSRGQRVQRCDIKPEYEFLKFFGRLGDHVYDISEPIPRSFPSITHHN